MISSEELALDDQEIATIVLSYHPKDPNRATSELIAALQRARAQGRRQRIGELEEENAALRLKIEQIENSVSAWDWRACEAHQPLHSDDPLGPCPFCLVIKADAERERLCQLLKAIRAART